MSETPKSSALEQRTADGGAPPRSDEADSSDRADDLAPNQLAIQLGRLYRTYCYDLIVDLAHTVAVAAVQRPLTFRNSDNFSQFVTAKAEYGATSDWMSPAQRADVYSAFFSVHPLGGVRSASSAFDVSTAAVRHAATDVTSAVYEQSAEALLSVLVREAHGFRIAAITPWRLAMLTELSDIMDTNLSNAVDILSDRSVATAFAKEPITDEDWPSVIDAAGAELVAALAADLGSDSAHVVTDGDFIKLQRVAEAGCETIGIVGRFPDRPDQPLARDVRVQALLASAVEWERALDQLSDN